METTMTINRRRLLTAGMASLTAAAAARWQPSWGADIRQATSRLTSMGLELITVWEPLEQDFEGTLRKVFSMGYRQVETLGAFGRDPAHVREMLDRSGLVSRSQHVMPADLYPLIQAFKSGRIAEKKDFINRIAESMPIDRMSIIVEEGIGRARMLGQKHIVWSPIRTDHLSDRAQLDGYCQALNRAGDQCAREGMIFGVHNHSLEFQAVNGYTPYDVILTNTNPDTVKFEMDVYWVVAAHADPVTYLSRYPGRIRQLHLKDCDAKGEVTLPGTGLVDFPAVLKAAKHAGVENYYVEFDNSPDPMAVIQQCYNYFANLSSG
jgi:sugar phosphate isomerase/epimerase